jgi:hypothetical protein
VTGDCAMEWILQHQIVSGSIVEATEDEKLLGLRELLKKYYQNNDDMGQQYIDKQKDNTKVFRIIPENISGKSKK